MTVKEKTAALFQSRRFWVAVGSVFVVLAGHYFGIDEETANRFIAVAVSWIVGDSLRETRVYFGD